jgi:hypothetical protein
MYKRNLIDYLPEFLKEIREYKAILTDAVQPEVVKLFEAIENAMNDQFILDATENGVSRWEKMLKIVPKATHSLDDRKFTILTKINDQIPYTMTSLKQKLKALCGEDGYSVELDASKFTLKVRIALAAQNAFESVCAMLEQVVPANMIIDISLLYNKNQTLHSYTHKQLSAYTHEQLRNGVVE